MNKYIPTKKDLVTSIAAAIAGLGVLIFSIIIVTAKVHSINQGLSEVRQVTQGMDKTYLIKKDLADYKDQISTIDLFFLKPGDEIGFIEKLETVATTSRVKLEISSISDTKDSKKATSESVDTLTLKAHLEGGLDQIADFLKKVENLKLATSIGNVELSQMTGLVWRGDLEISVLKTKN